MSLWDADDEDDWGDDPADEVESEADDEPTLPCPFCRREIHEEAERCPYCEQCISDEDRRRGAKPWWIVIGVVLCLVMMLWWLVL